MEIGKMIYEKRKEKKLSLEKLGDMIGVSKVTISKWEKGNIKNMGRDKIAKLSNILDIPIPTLLGCNYIDTYEKENKITDKEFELMVKELLNKTENINDNDKNMMITVLENICNKNK